MAPTPRIRPYKDFLTPLMHRRFAGATAILSIACYVVSVLIGEKKSFLWFWFPLGIAGIRAALIFISAFSIFILRVAQLHVGIRTSMSGWDTFSKCAYSFQVVQTLGWYTFSAYIFSEVCIWSAGKNSDLQRIDVAAKTDRISLNEKPIFFTCCLLFLAAAQTGVHLYYDYDRIDMPVMKRLPMGSTDMPAPIVHPARQVWAKLLRTVVRSGQRVVIMSAVSVPLYYMRLGIFPYSAREIAWAITRSWAKLFWKLPRSSSLPTIGPFHHLLLLEVLKMSFYLTMLWEVGNIAFSTYVAQEPLKNDRPITYESRDPNGSLLTGLTGKKLQTQAFAFWELSSIAERFEGRRKIIFEDIDRKGGSAWSQILGVSLGLLTGMSLRIAEFERPPAPTSSVAPASAPVSGLPRMAPPLKNSLGRPGDLFAAEPKPTTPSESALQAVGKYARTHGQSPPEGLSPKSRRLLAQAAALTPETQAIAAQGVGGIFRDWALRIVRHDIIGQPFRQEYRRRIAAIVLGSPYGDVGIVIDAVDTLTRLAVCSLTEDRYGNVQRDVKLIIQTFTSTINTLERFKDTLPLHWTDVDGQRESPEVDATVATLKNGLGRLVDAFATYALDLRLTQAEMRQARDAARPAVVA